MNLPDMYERQQLSIPQIADATGMSRSTVRRRLLSAGVVLRTRADGVRLSGPRISEMQKGVPILFTPERCAAISAGRRRWADANARGVRVNTSGYLEFTRGPHKGRHVHTVLMEQRIGRRLSRNEVVHHRDGDRANNDINNLRLMSRAAHSSLHRRNR